MQTVKVWDIWVRFTHWTVAGIVFANLLFTEEGEVVHRYIGYLACGLVVSRLLWGFIGSRYARFSSFFPTPSRIVAHIRHMKAGEFGHDVGHNPIGALMMFALWGAILGLGVSGFMMETDAYWGNETVMGIHEVLANLMWVLIGLHVAAVFVMSFLSKTNLARAMVTGKKTVGETETSVSD